MTGRLEGRRAVITGAARGLGLACAKRFVSEGARVVLADIDATEGAAAAATFSPGTAIFCPATSPGRRRSRLRSCAAKPNGAASTSS